MKISKKSSFLSLFLAGTLVLGASAAADVIIGDGYNSAKQALKYTSKTLANNVDSYTVDAEWQISLDGEEVMGETNTIKYDFVNSRHEEQGEIKNGNEVTSSYTYSDKDRMIYHYSDDDSYSVYNKDDSDDVDDKFGITDPFEEPIAADIEKIADAFVSNMKDFVQVKELDDGGKIYFGNLESSQIPALANAISSFLIKYSVAENLRYMDVINIKDSISLGEVSAQVSQNADGLLDSGVASVSATGTDENGNYHKIEMSVSLTLGDVNSTVVEPISLEGKNVTYSKAYDNRYTIDEKYIGTYTAPIVEVENDKFVRTGENKLIIDSVEDGVISGHISMMNGDEAIDSDFSAKKREDDYADYSAQYTDSNGDTKNAVIRLVDWYGGEANMINVNVEFDVQFDEGGGYTSSGSSVTVNMQID